MTITKMSKLSGAGPLAQDWVRPTDWLAMPDIPAGTQKVICLAAIYPDNVNSFAVFCTGAYTVDWGDGTAPVNYATGVKAEKNILWANVSASTLTSEGFRQALVTITPQAGNSLTQVNFEQVPTGFSQIFVPQWRDIIMRVPQCSALIVGGQSATYNQARWVTILGTTAMTSVIRVFKNMPQLRGVTGTTFASSNNTFSEWFTGCNLLQSVPALDTSASTNFANMFTACASLKTVPLLNTSLGTAFNQMFSGCYNLQVVPLFDFSKAQSLNAIFTNCYSLTTVPLFNTSLCIDFTTMFVNCNRLTSVPLFDTSKGTVFASMFLGCSSLRAVPLFNTSLGTNFSSMFGNCISLQTIPQLDLSSGTNFTSIFDGCTSLSTLPTLNTSKGTVFSNFIWNAASVQNIDIDCSALTVAASGSQMIQAGNRSLRSILLRNLKVTPTSFSIANQGLNAQAMNDFYTALGTASGAQTLTLTGNPGSGSSNTAIATAKGWTVTGG